MTPEDRPDADELLQRGADLIDQSKRLLEELDERIGGAKPPD